MDNLLCTNYPSISSIDPTLQSYFISTKIEDSYYNKNEIDTTLALYTPTAQTSTNVYSKLYNDNTCLTSAQTGFITIEQTPIIY